MIPADSTVFFWINGLAGRVPIIDGLMRLLASDYFIPLVMALTLFALWFSGRDATARERNQRTVWCALIAAGFACLVVEIFNCFFDRPRPFEMYPGMVQLLFYQPSDPSFPSNMAAVTFGFAAGTWQGNRRAGWLLLIPALLACFARVYVGIHFPLDIAGGAAIGIVMVPFALLVLRIGEPIPTWVLTGMRRLYLA